MKATFTDRKTKFSTSHRKEKAGLHKCYAMLVPATFHDGEKHARTIAELRIYWPANNPFACLWVNSATVNTSGSGTAGGGGYDKASAAAQAAMQNAGFDLSQSISGIGESAIREAMHAIAAAAGHPQAMLFETHP